MPDVPIVGMMIMLFLRDNDGCMKTELYSAVSSNPRMPEKLNLLESTGLILQERNPDSRAVRIRMTDLGRRASSVLSDVDSLMSRPTT